MGSSEGAAKLFAGPIESTIRAFAAGRGARVERDILLDVGERTEPYSFILIDRHGLLGIDVQMWVGAEIEGSGSSKSWSARLKGEKPSKFESGLEAGSRRVRTLNEVLAACGRRLGPEYVAHLVVFAGADLSKLQLTPVERLTVIAADDLGSTLEARYDFAVNPGALVPGEVSDLASLLTTLNRFDDAEAQARHAGLVSETPGLFGKRFERQREVQVGVSDSASGVAPAAMRLAQDRYPSHSPSASSTQKRPTPRIVWLVLVALVLLSVWLFALGGLTTVSDVVGAVLSTGSRQVTQPATSVDAQSPLVELDHAQATLKETAPEVFAQATDLDSPMVNHAEGFSLYTWHYVEQSGQPRTMTLTFDASGMLRGANRQ